MNFKSKIIGLFLSAGLAITTSVLADETYSCPNTISCHNGMCDIPEYWNFYMSEGSVVPNAVLTFTSAQTTQPMYATHPTSSFATCNYSIYNSDGSVLYALSIGRNGLSSSPYTCTSGNWENTQGCYCIRPGSHWYYSPSSPPAKGTDCPFTIVLSN